MYRWVRLTGAGEVGVFRSYFSSSSDLKEHQGGRHDVLHHLRSFRPDGGEADGPPRLHRLRVLGSDSLLRPHRALGVPVDHGHPDEDPAGLLLPFELVRQPLPLRPAHPAVPEGLFHPDGQVRVGLVVVLRTGQVGLFILRNHLPSHQRVFVFKIS